MAKAKDIIIKPISSHDASKIIKKYHYSGKIVPNSKFHYGVFLDGACLGAMSFGCPMDKRRSIALVTGTPWNGMLELNRMAFSDLLPKNSESRALGYVFRLFKKIYPQLKWVLSFADGTQCGDGAIYRATGFVLTGIKKNSSLLKMPDGKIIARKTLDNRVFENGKYGSSISKELGATKLPGFQLRYIYFLDENFKKNLTCKILDFKKIDEVGASMYRGKKRAGSKASVATSDQGVEGGATPTPAPHILTAGS